MVIQRFVPSQLELALNLLRWGTKNQSTFEKFSGNFEMLASISIW
jgi:hypothetical protein